MRTKFELFVTTVESYHGKTIYLAKIHGFTFGHTNIIGVYDTYKKAEERCDLYRALNKPL
jgi:hypothetical protein